MIAKNSRNKTVFYTEKSFKGDSSRFTFYFPGLFGNNWVWIDKDEARTLVKELADHFGFEDK